jgi:hypothetical protein
LNHFVVLKLAQYGIAAGTGQWSRASLVKSKFYEMCRFAIYLGEPVLLTDFVIKPTHSIIYQSFDSLERGNGSPLNGDGFGLAW